MDVKAIIDSGVLEEYVLGTASDQDMRAVRCLSSIYPELLEEIERIESRLIQTGESAAPDDLVFDVTAFQAKINETPQLPKLEKSIEIPSAQPTVRTMPPRSSGWVYRAAAIVLLFTTIAALWYAMDQQSRQREMAAVMEDASKDIGELELQMGELENLQAFLTDASVVKVTLASMDSTVSQQATVFWSNQSKKVFIDYASMPKPPQGKQYQLWTLVDGQPIDQGVIPIESGGLVQMKAADLADAFAITLEDEGGKPTPTLSELKVLGKV
ncbi:MAG: anti-sigma factor [Flavobacteriales bacterium]|nr:anti-sigma factor [Flavobacteriales bacterium]